MFDVTCVRTRAGYIGQVVFGGKILWESDPFPSEVVPRPDDKLARTTNVGSERAYQAARNKLDAVMEGLFS